MASSIASQLQTLRSLVNCNPEATKAPVTRPSILFEPKKAADIDIDAIFRSALAGLDVLINTDRRFSHHRNDLFSDMSKELDRELMGLEDNNQINVSISSYLRLLSGYFQLPSAWKTIEYLIRKYKIHVYNTEELILCALPYHDTHIFVRIVQLINTGNNKWHFLDGVKESGAPPPRKVIVQQCISDKGVLEALCDYALPTKKFQPSRTVISFCTTVVVEVLGSLQSADADIVKRALPFVSSGLLPGGKGGPEQKAGALIIVGLLANKVALSPNLVKSWIRSIASLAREDAKELSDLQWVRMSVMALINLVQLQSVEMFPKKTVEILNDIRELSGVLTALTKEFDIDKFLTVYLDSLIEYSSDDDRSHHTLLSLLETVPLKYFIDRIVSRLLDACVKLSKKKDDMTASKSGSQAKQILLSINKKYPLELRGSIRSFLEGGREQSRNEHQIYESLCSILDGNSDLSFEISDSKIWFGLEHPKAEVRRASLLGLDAVDISNEKAVNSQRLVSIQDAVLRRLQDDDFSVVQEALNLRRLLEIISGPCLIDALQNVLQRCIRVLFPGRVEDKALTINVAVLCLQHAFDLYKDEYAERIARMMFPLLLILPKTQRLHLKALSLAKETNWPFYQKLVPSSSTEKKLEPGHISSINMDNISYMAETFLTSTDEHRMWLIECRNESELSKTLFFLVLLQSFTASKIDVDLFFARCGLCCPVLQIEWELLESAGHVASIDESNTGMLDGDCKAFLDHLSKTNLMELNAIILIALFWRLLDAFISKAPKDISPDKSEKCLWTLQDLFVFFASRSKHVFKKHIRYLVMKCHTSPVRFLSKIYCKEGVSVAVQVESLRSFTFLCSQSDEEIHFQLLAEFPTLLVPLSSDDEAVRLTAMSCVEGLSALWPSVNLSSRGNGSNAAWSHFLGELLVLMVQQKWHILSDRNGLTSFFTNLLSITCHALLVQKTIGQSFDQSSKEDILTFILSSALELSAYAKLMILSTLKGVGSKVMHVKGVESLLCELLKRRQQCHLGCDKSSHTLSQIEVETLCLLLEICTMASGSHALNDHVLRALQLDGVSSEDPAIIQPCLIVLRKLSDSFYGGLMIETQEHLFRELLYLFRSANGDVQNATKDALLRINISCSSICRMLDFVLEQRGCLVGATQGKKKRKLTTHPEGGDACSLLSSLLDVMLLKKNIENRASLIGPLFNILRQILTGDDLIPETGVFETLSTPSVHIQQTLLLILKDISVSLTTDSVQKESTVCYYDFELLVTCARSAKDAMTRNQVFTLLSTLAKIVPDKVLEHILGILRVVGESATTQWDSYSQHVFEDLISALVPCWLSKTDNAEELLQIFINVLPQVAEHRRLTIIMPLLSILGKSMGLGLLLLLLFRSLASKASSTYLENIVPSMDHLITTALAQWEYAFALQLSNQYSCTIWLSSLVLLLQQMEMRTSDPKHFMELLFVTHFMSDKLRDPELAFKFNSGEDLEDIQGTVGALMEQVVCHQQLVDSRRKQTGVPTLIRKEVKNNIHTVLKHISQGLVPSAYFRVIIKLLSHADKNVRRKVLGLLSETVKNSSSVNLKHERRGVNARSSWLHLDKNSLESFNFLCLEIVKLIDGSDGDANLKAAAASALDILANNFPSSDSTFSQCLAAVAKNIPANDPAVSSSCLRATGAFVNVLGPRALPVLPSIMECLLKRSHDESISMSILLTLEAVLNKLGGFLNPYLEKILKLLILDPEYASSSDPKLKIKADAVRKLFTGNIPVRLSLPPLLGIYNEATKCGDSSLAAAFEMLAHLVRSMDRSSVGSYHRKIFELCLLGLDIRHQCPISIKNVDFVEKNVINVMVALTMKLTETMFKPLFVRSIEWLDSHVEESTGITNTDRAISFYGFVNKLSETHRSLFVPYFKYLLDGCVRFLTDAADAKAPTRKKKKTQLQEEDNKKKQESREISVGRWHLRALVISALHKCFLYDSGDLKFLDSSNFQILLKPVVSQLAAEPPVSLEEYPTTASSVKEVDDLLVDCISQMAATAGSDLLWKPLNHEVLMHTRSENVRTRILGLRIVKSLLEKLKEEYLVLLPETIPFLGELLEDVEIPVKSLSQEILREMESMSGESLQEYL